MALNKSWHLANKMPQHATLVQRVQWHIEHAKNCSCRQMPASIKAIVEKQKIKK
jgi:hypothetical protein